MTDIYERAKADDEAWEREHDNRDKLEADLLALMKSWHDHDGDFMKLYSSVAYAQVKELLDRQAAITERHWMEINGANTLANIEINKQREELQAKVDELEAQLAQCMESYADAKNSRDRLQAQLDSAKYDCLTCDAKAELQRKVDDLQVELDAYDQTHMVLPLDADGVPIKIGDKIQQLNHAGVWTDAMPVIAVDDHGCFALAHGIACDARTYVWGNNCRHVKPRTVEDVLRELADVARHDSEHELDDGDIDGFAAEIRELMGVCDE